MTSPGTSWGQARAIAGDIGPLPSEPAGLGQALGAVLAHDLRAPAGLPAVVPGGRRVVGLPGNPFAAVAGILTLLAPLLTALSGAGSAPETLVRRLEDTPRRTGHTALLPVRQDERGDLQLLPRSSSASLRTVAYASHLLAVADSDEAVLVPVPTGLLS